MIIPVTNPTQTDREGSKLFAERVGKLSGGRSR